MLQQVQLILQQAHLVLIQLLIHLQLVHVAIQRQLQSRLLHFRQRRLHILDRHIVQPELRQLLKQEQLVEHILHLLEFY